MSMSRDPAFKFVADSLLLKRRTLLVEEEDVTKVLHVIDRFVLDRLKILTNLHVQCSSSQDGKWRIDFNATEIQYAKIKVNLKYGVFHCPMIASK